MSVTFRSYQTGNVYRVVGRTVVVRYAGTPLPTVLQFDTPREARHYASRHGQIVRRTR